MKICTVADCGSPHRGRGLCNKHYKREFRKPRSPELTAWTNMKDRCYNKNYQNYERYGGRGITVWDGWRNNFEAFHLYVGDKPSVQHSLDRIDNNKGYEPGNVRWATPHQQSANICTNTEVVGVNFNRRFGIWQARLMINRKNVLNKRFTNFDDAVDARKKAETTYNISLNRRVMQ